MPPADPTADEQPPDPSGEHDPSDQGEPVRLPLDGNGPVPVVGIGASAGGLDAVGHFLAGLPAAPGMAFVVVQHLAPDHESALAELLRSSTPLDVRQIEHGMEVEADHVYVIPPGKSLVLRDGVLRLDDPDRPRGQRAPIDAFLRSLAEDRRENAVAVILSGTGSDGSLGIKAVKEAGGLTLAQDPDDAEYPGMPRSAVGTGLVDVTGEAGALAAQLLRLREHAPRVRVAAKPTHGDSDLATLPRVLVHLRERTGHDFTHYKRSTILRRLGRRMQVHGVEGVPEYLELLRSRDDEAQALRRDFLISVTSFFRDPAAFEALEKTVIPAVFERKQPNDAVRVWVAGCATGEEAYSIGMLLCEHASRLGTDAPDLQVFATDVDADAIAFAREGVYPDAVAADVTPERLRRFFTQEGGGLRVRKEIREIVLFAPHDILRDPPFSRIDLVTCRNLLIYLNREVQGKVLELLHYALTSDGFLFLGSSESPDGAHKLFTNVDKRHRIYRRRPASSTGLPRFPTVPVVAGPTRRLSPATRDEGPLGIEEIHRRRVVARHAPPSLFVDENYELAHVIGGAGRFLVEGDGVPTQNVLDKVPAALRLDLRTALYRVFHRAEPVRTGPVTLEAGGERVTVRLDVEPVHDPDLPRPYAEVVFREAAAPSDESETTEPPGRDDVLARQVEDELIRTRERLQTAIEEYETANEELKASNEELQSMNEELQSTTEELETGKEELQSMNEELVTVNQELRTKVEELARANSDLQNLMGSTDVATLFLDRDLAVKRYTPRIREVFHVIPGDVGRPLAHVAHRLRYADLLGDAERVLRSLVPVEREVRTDDDQIHLLRILPYRTVDDVIDGVVLTLTDVSDWRAAEERSLFQASVLSQIGDAVIALDTDGCVTYANAAAGEMYGFDAAAARGRPLSALYHYRWLSPEDEAAAMETLERRGRWRGEVVHVTPDGREFTVEAAVSNIRDSMGRHVGRLGVMRDVTERHRAEQRLRAARDEADSARRAAEAANAAKSAFLASVSHELRTPLNAVIGYADLLEMGVPDSMPDACRGHVARIRLSAEHLLQLIEEILAFARLEAAQESVVLEECSVQTLIDEANAIIAPLAATKELAFSATLDPAARRVRTDARKLRQILLNLLGNAVKFTDRGRVELEIGAHADGVRIDVRDTGIGMTSTQQEHLFEPFWQAESTLTRKASGTGLGLAITHRYVEMLGGTIAVSSRDGEGTTFTVVLPPAPKAGSTG